MNALSKLLSQDTYFYKKKPNDNLNHCLSDSFFIHLFYFLSQINVFLGHFTPDVMGVEANRDGAVYVCEFWMVISPLAVKGHFSDKADSFGKTAKPVGFADGVICKFPTGEAGYRFLDLIIS